MVTSYIGEATKQKTFQILCVDDDSSMLHAIKRMLRGTPYQVSLAGSGKQGYKFYKKGSFDLALVDINMTGMSGLDCLKKIRKSDPDFPVVMMTGSISSALFVKSIKLQCDAYLEKPFDKERLCALLDKTLQSEAG